jgi:hypothetical protein
VTFALSIKWEYRQQDETGKLAGPTRAGWDLRRNVKL